MAINVLWFQDCSHNHKRIVGGKNASLGELKRVSETLNINVGNGFAITTFVYDYFCKVNDLNNLIDEELEKVVLEDIESIERASAKIKSLFVKGDLPESILNDIRNAYYILKKENDGSLEVAVRSSAIAEDMPNASFAGQQDTFLNISNVVDLMEAIILCFASLYNVRAISYRKTHNIDKNDLK